MAIEGDWLWRNGGENRTYMDGCINNRERKVGRWWWERG